MKESFKENHKKGDKNALGRALRDIYGKCFIHRASKGAKKNISSRNGNLKRLFTSL